MEKVVIRLSNIQSHENTSFVLEPGLNFILANDNNVGKSAIFKILMAVAKAPNNTTARLKSLLRMGCNRAYAAFDYSDGRVIAWIQRDSGKAPNMFFEHTDESGVTVRGIAAPQSLLSALGIALDKDGNVINFNDADSVQLISKTSTEADNILTSVILDATVEQMKANLYRFNRDLDSEIKLMRVKKEDAEDSLKRLSYNPMVGDFFENLNNLQAMCALCDDIPDVSEFDSGRTFDNYSELKTFREVLIGLGENLPVVQVKDAVNLDNSMQVYCELLGELSKVLLGDFVSLLGLEEIKCTLPIYRSVLNLIGRASRDAWVVADQQIAIDRGDKTMQDLRRQIESQSVVVQCPVKGKVFFTDETCIPVGD